ncbi:MAG: DsbA family protein [Elainellaceae cyanobacterium]
MSIPVPPRFPGYRLSSGDASVQDASVQDAPVQIEVFLDLECPFSKKAWPTMLALINQGDPPVAITAHMIVLCDHRQSWDLTKALTEVAGNDGQRGWKFISHLYQHQQDFNSAAFEDKTRQDLFRLMGRLVESFDPALPASELVKDSAEDGGAIASCAKRSIRYAADRGVWSTPTFIINGSKVPQLESSSTLSDWQAFLASL